MKKAYQPLDKLFISTFPKEAKKLKDANVLDNLLLKACPSSQHNSPSKPCQQDSCPNYSALKSQEVIDLVAYYFSNILMKFFENQGSDYGQDPLTPLSEEFVEPRYCARERI